MRPISCTSTVERLEARQFLSGGHLHVHHTTHVISPAPAHHVKRSGGGHTGLPGGAPRNALTSTILGNWINNQDQQSDTPVPSLSLKISQNRNGDYLAQVTFAGAITFDRTAPMTFNAKTGRFSVLIVSPKLVVKLDGILTSNRETPELQVGLAYYMVGGSFKSTMTLLPTL